MSPCVKTLEIVQEQAKLMYTDVINTINLLYLSQLLEATGLDQIQCNTELLQHILDIIISRTSNSENNFFFLKIYKVQERLASFFLQLCSPKNQNIDVVRTVVFPRLISTTFMKSQV